VILQHLLLLFFLFFSSFGHVTCGVLFWQWRQEGFMIWKKKKRKKKEKKRFFVELNYNYD